MQILWLYLVNMIFFDWWARLIEVKLIDWFNFDLLRYELLTVCYHLL